MQHISTTPFGRRPVTAGHLANLEAAAGPPALLRIDKWQILGELKVARKAYGLTDRDLAVLDALLSFHPGRSLDAPDNLVVFPSNASLADRAHGMAESTLRRHLAALVAAGVVLRRDSPNGKRYRVRTTAGETARAFGFDLRPLLVLAPQIIDAARMVREEADLIQARREEISLLKRDAMKLAFYAQEAGFDGEWQDILNGTITLHRAMRRSLSREALDALHQDATDLLNRTQNAIDSAHRTVPEDLETASETSVCDSRNERHIQNTNTYTLDSEQAEKSCYAETDSRQTAVREHRPHAEIGLKLAAVLRACPELLIYAERRIADWTDLAQVASRVGPMMGIGSQVWREACARMGPGTAATVVACMLQRISSIRNPGGYLRNLSKRALAGVFSPEPMVRALAS